jgi:hypothetical protein
MDRDMHYCVVKILALKAGFTSRQSELIAYASEYVDDAVENKPMKVHFPDGVPTEILDYKRYNARTGRFDPTCTAHRGIHWLRVMLKRAIQKKVYVCFHLVPARPYPGTGSKKPPTPRGSYSYITEMGSVFARAVVDESIRELEASEFSSRKLIKLGIALHTFADTYSHYGFSGRNSCDDNNRKHIRVIYNNVEETFRGMNRLESMLTPRFAHAVALAVPDTSHLQLSFEKDGARIKRDNPKNYLRAAEEIYEILISITGRPNTWVSFSDRLAGCISRYQLIGDYSGETPAVFQQKFADYGKAFGLCLSYSEEDWRRKALKANNYDWIRYSRRQYRNEMHGHIGDMRWYYFHMGAHEQREFVMGKIRRDLK